MMSEKRFTNVSIGMEEAYCDFSIIKVGDKIISDGIPTTDAIGICELLNELNDENKELKKVNEDLREVNKENQLLHEENVKQCERWRNLYELKDAEVTARVDTLNRVCEYYLSEVQFIADTDPNEAVKEVINEILNAPIYEE
jgi:hypothetical protein